MIACRGMGAMRKDKLPRSKVTVPIGKYDRSKSKGHINKGGIGGAGLEKRKYAEGGKVKPNLDGLRPDGTPKGKGWLGILPMTDGSGRHMTELSISVGRDNSNSRIRKILIPTLVPTLSPDQLNHLLSGGEGTPEIARIAEEHARKMIRKGRSPFYD